MKQIEVLNVLSADTRIPMLFKLLVFALPYGQTMFSTSVDTFCVDLTDLILLALQTKIDICANSVDPDGTARNK